MGASDRNRNVNIVIRARNEASKALDSVLSSVTSLTGIAATAAAGAAYMAFAFTKVTKAAMEQENADVRLAAALASIGENTAENREHLARFIGQLEDITGVSDEAIQSAVALLAQLGELSGEGLENATQAALDLSAALGMDLQSAATLVAKAAQGNTAALSRYGIVLDEAIPKTERGAAALKLLEQRFGGAAEAAGTTLEKALSRIANSFDNLEQAIGKTVVENEAFRALLAIVNDLLKQSQGWVEGNTGAFNQMVTAVAKGAIAFLKFGLEVANAQARQAEILLTTGQVAAAIAGLASVAPAITEKLFGVGGEKAKEMAKGAANVIVALQHLKNVAGGVSESTAAAIQAIEQELEKLDKGGFKVGQTFRNQAAPGVEAFDFQLDELATTLDAVTPNLTKLDDIMRMLGGSTLIEVGTQMAAVDSALNQLATFDEGGLPEQFRQTFETLLSMGEALGTINVDLSATKGHVVDIRNLWDEAGDLVGGHLTGSVLSFSDALIDTAFGAKVAWDQFWKSMLANMLKALSQMLLLELIAGTFTGGASLAASFAGGGGGTIRGFSGLLDSFSSPVGGVFPPSSIGVSGVSSLERSVTQPGAGPSTSGTMQMFNQIVPLRDRESEVADLINDISTAVERRGYHLVASRVVS